ncbi:MAG TPA: glycine betaine ABC transporter substrate-binding protein [Burkholderiales bacterium]|nr:glycine betaine ABC transporter substrate-binding protein [Burkholderiales bacterium]
MRTVFATLLALACCTHAAAETLVVGSKRFTESYILGEIIALTAGRAGEAQVEHRPGLGNTGIVYQALRSGEIDLYAEYTGTIEREILKGSQVSGLEGLNRVLASQKLAVGVPLGFNNTYALAMREASAQTMGVRAISDLARKPEVVFGLSQEFIGRNDGWPGLKKAYKLPQPSPRGLDHGLAYEAITAGQVDVIDAYSTDAKIGRFRLRVLDDDLHYFPVYDAVLFYRADLPQRLPRTWAALQTLQGSISASRMIALNARAELDGLSFAEVAQEFLDGREAEASSDKPALAKGSFLQRLFAPDFARLAWEHLLLVLVSLAGATALGIPLGVLAYRAPRARQWVLSGTGIVQTIPSLALFAFLIPLFGMIGTVPALVALFLYALLPIVRNTYSGLADIAPGLRESALALGVSPSFRLLKIELPLASRSIIAGVKTSAVINVGTATIAAFIGAGGFGERIAQGLALNDNAALLAGAVPAAALALLVHGGFELLDRWLLPAGLREPVLKG